MRCFWGNGWRCSPQAHLLTRSPRHYFKPRQALAESIFKWEKFQGKPERDGNGLSKWFAEEAGRLLILLAKETTWICSKSSCTFKEIEIKEKWRKTPQISHYPVTTIISWTDYISKLSYSNWTTVSFSTLLPLTPDLLQILIPTIFWPKEHGCAK